MLRSASKRWTHLILLGFKLYMSFIVKACLVHLLYIKNMLTKVSGENSITVEIMNLERAIRIQ